MTTAEDRARVNAYTFTDGTLGFCVDGGWKSTNYHEIPQEEYDKYIAMENSEFQKYVSEEVITDAVRYGYGFYGAYLYKDDEGKCFLGIASGNSCD